jgi:hypothetical protein
MKYSGGHTELTDEITNLSLQLSELGLLHPLTVDSPITSHADECLPPWLRGEAPSLAGEGVGGPDTNEGDRNCGTLGIYVLYG